MEVREASCLGLLSCCCEGVAFLCEGRPPDEQKPEEGQPQEPWRGEGARVLLQVRGGKVSNLMGCFFSFLGALIFRYRGSPLSFSFFDPGLCWREHFPPENLGMVKGSWNTRNQWNPWSGTEVSPSP